jgi:NAD(P) transhydrogenase subunit beta
MSEAAALPTPNAIAYLVASILFIVGLKRLSSPATARSGNRLAALGMAIAIGATLSIPGLSHHGLLALALAIGLVAGVFGGRLVRMTDMPQMVAILNGLGGGAAALVSAAEFLRAAHIGVRLGGATEVSIALGTVIGAVSFSGSLVAFGKLQGIISEKAIASGVQRIVNAALVAFVLASFAAVVSSGSLPWFLALMAWSLLLGVLMVIPIGGADMPVVISLLNSCTGLAAAATGFVLENNALIISGMLVGASGTLLTLLMCTAMNRSLWSVLVGGFGAAPAAGAAKATGAGTPDRPVREVNPEDTAVLLSNVHSVIIVPGYGMAVAQAQHIVRELADLLTRRGVDVKYAIHPVAGRMPGHMNVLLAEANVPYEQLFDLEAINDEFPRADVALVIGANDVVNPAARNDPASPIYGMPILDADRAQHVIVVKRSLNPGFAGIDNPIYYEPRTMMLFGDAKGVIEKVVNELKKGGA